MCVRFLVLSLVSDTDLSGAVVINPCFLSNNQKLDEYEPGHCRQRLRSCAISPESARSLRFGQASSIYTYYTTYANSYAQCLVSEVTSLPCLRLKTSKYDVRILLYTGTCVKDVYTMIFTLSLIFSFFVIFFFPYQPSHIALISGTSYRILLTVST